MECYTKRISRKQDTYMDFWLQTLMQTINSDLIAFKVHNAF